MAKFCTSCGAPLGDSLKFCTSCGTKRPEAVRQALPTQQPQYTSPVPAKKKNKTPLIIGGVAALAVLVVIIAVSGKRNDPKTGDPFGDPISTNALAGNWGRHEKRLPYWVFGADGRYVSYDAQSIAYNPSTGIMASKYERWEQGKYRVNGNAIEFYDCRVSSYFKYNSSWLYFDETPYNLPANTLLDTPLPDPEKIDDYSVKFEFHDAMRLRLVVDRSLINYDSDFDYDGDRHNVAIPTHSIPAAAWPAELPSFIPEYGSGGRLREADTTSHEGEISIVIDRTTREACSDYIRRVLQADWDNPWDDDDIEDAINGNYVSALEKNEHRLTISLYDEGTVHIGYWTSRW